MKCNCSATGSETPAIVKTVDGKVIACGFLRLGKDHGLGFFSPIGRLMTMAAFPEVSVEVAERDANDKGKFCLHTHKLRNWRFHAAAPKENDATAAAGDQYQFDAEVV